ncbi:MAG: hypothetical protein K2J88_07765, partial [Oscillospiraceae bacterium]|nr:hypothetical protein [Oscillospiraceae bacterium]
MKLCTGQCRYLFCIYRLAHTDPNARIRCVDIARDLNVTRPSVSKMIKCMVRMELIQPDYCDSVVLTPKGKEIAEKINANYDLIYAFFRQILRLPSQEAKDHAFIFLTTFPESTVKQLCNATDRTLEKIVKKNHAIHK